MILDERSKLDRPFPVVFCQNSDCGTNLSRDAYLLLDTYVRFPVVYCDDCARYAVACCPERFKPVVEP